MGSIPGRQIIHMKVLGGSEGVGRALHIPGRGVGVEQKTAQVGQAGRVSQTMRSWLRVWS